MYVLLGMWFADWEGAKYFYDIDQGVWCGIMFDLFTIFMIFINENID